jgi:hypothetical protein
MSPLDQSLAYAACGWPVFPCQWQGPGRKRPLTDHGFLDASTNPVAITKWWRRWPDALIGLRTGLSCGRAVLDVDVKRRDAYGLDTLGELGFAILPSTSMVHTESAGFHMHFDPGGREIPSTQGAIGCGIGPGLDWRGEGGYAILPSPGSGYWWDPHYGLDAALAPIPPSLMPREPEGPAADARPVKPEDGLSPYAEAALDSACRLIRDAADGEQEKTLSRESFSLGTLAGAGAIPEGFARQALLWAARQIISYDSKRPWRPTELEQKVNHAFDAGMRRPREARRA